MKLKFSRSALFHVKTRIYAKYIIPDWRLISQEGFRTTLDLES